MYICFLLEIFLHYKYCATYVPGVPQGEGFIRRAGTEGVRERKELDAIDRVSVTSQRVATAQTKT